MAISVEQQQIIQDMRKRILDGDLPDTPEGNAELKAAIEAARLHRSSIPAPPQRGTPKRRSMSLDSIFAEAVGDDNE
jgi:hypothetical protein